MTPLVSILIPAHNAEAWIADTIQSALAQTWPRKEIIVVDDGSKDQTRSVARQFASRGVSVVTQTNQGAAAARNRAYADSRGDYIQWLDADDLLAPDKIARQMEALKTCRGKQTLLSGAWAYFMFRPCKAAWSSTALYCDLSSVEWVLRKMEQNAFMLTPSWLVSRNLTEAAGPWDTRLSADDDGEYFSRVILASDGVQFVPEARVFYRISGVNSLSYLGQNNVKLESQLLAMRLQIDHLRATEDSKRVRAASLKFLQRSMICFYPERPDLVKQMEQLAGDLGGQLEAPQLSWKYAWIQKAFGWNAAKRTQRFYNQSKFSVLRSWDKLLFRLKIESTE
jgi:glycosyltransferase involved in cell wall biosynthesis